MIVMFQNLLIMSSLLYIFTRYLLVSPQVLSDYYHHLSTMVIIISIRPWNISLSCKIPSNHTSSPTTTLAIRITRSNEVTAPLRRNTKVVPFTNGTSSRMNSHGMKSGGSIKWKENREGRPFDFIIYTFTCSFFFFSSFH